MLKARLKALFTETTANRLPWRSQVSHAQCGEDMALLAHLRWAKIQRGFYLDVGAFHPVFLSNTYALYRAGWRGITVEPTPGAAEQFRTVRPRDVHLPVAVSPEPTDKPLTFYSFGQGSPYNTLSADSARDHERASGNRATPIDVPCLTLNQILERHLPAGESLTVLSIDVEGMDDALLASFDFARFAPYLVVFEIEGVLMRDLPQHSLFKLVESHGYDVFGRMGPSLIAYRP